MATNVYKVGGCIYAHETGADLDVIDFPTISYSGFETKGDDIILYNHIDSSIDNSERSASREHFQGITIAIADVRSDVGAAIGSNTKSEVRDYIAGLLE